jgi:hypothetical protein
MKKLGLVAVLLIVVAAVSQIRVDGPTVESVGSKTQAEKMDLSSVPDTKPGRALRLLFIHHSVGGALFASPGAEKSVARCIWSSHPEGGSARALLEAQGYEVHEASYGSEVGERTDLLDWPAKFRKKMDRVLTCDRNDTFYGDGKQNDVVIFKSCFPNNRFVAEGTPPGNLEGPELTVWNARAALSALLPEFEKYPKTLFVYLTVPPLAPRVPAEPLWKFLAKRAMGKITSAAVLTRQGALAREFNDWTVASDGWLKDYPLKNVVVFDLFNLLTGDGASNLLRYPTEDGYDSHPSRIGNEKVAKDLVPFINRALRRAGLAD